MKKNYKDDFDFILRLYSTLADSNNSEVGDSRIELGWPDYDWVAAFYTSSKANAYVASCIGGECVNCYNDNGQIHIVVDNHHMGPGRLKVEFKAELPRDIYPDGRQRNVIPEPLDIELVVGKGDLPSEMEVDLLLPYIKGDAFTYADFTPEQMADLKRPATEAANSLDNFVRTASEAESTRVANEKSRVSAEATRVAQEESRADAEATREANETERRTAEALRAEAEEARKTAESKRATEFASWKTELDGKAGSAEVTQALAGKQDKLGTTGDLQIGEGNVLGLTEMAKKRLFCDMFNAACKWGKSGYANIVNGAFDCELNELKLTYEEAVAVMALPTMTVANTRRLYHDNKTARTHPPIMTYMSVTQGDATFSGTSFEVISAGSILPSGSMFYNCTKLRQLEMYSANQSSETSGNMYRGCVALEDIRVQVVYHSSFSLQDSPLLSQKSFAEIVAKTSATGGPFTITVHPDVYAKLSDESNTEWHQVLLDAAKKNITFATT